jgi:hypothetical protein
MKNCFRAMALLLIAAMLLSSCSMFSASSRRERAYERYVRKSSLARAKQEKRFRPTMTSMPPAQPSEPVESSGPEAVGTNDS